jgi:hypothetical protein
VYDREAFRPAWQKFPPRHIIYWNEEFRSTLWGHMTLIDLSQLVSRSSPVSDTTNPWDIPTPADIAKQPAFQSALLPAIRTNGE